MRAADKGKMSRARFRLLKPRDVSNHCPDRFCGFCGRLDDHGCASGAGADRQDLLRSPLRPPVPFRVASRSTGSRRRRRGAGTAARPPVADPNRPPPGQGAAPPGSFQSQPLAPPPGTTVVPQKTQPASRSPRCTRPQLANAPPGAARCRDCRRVNASPGRARSGRAAIAGHLAAGRRSGSEPPATKITNKKASFSGLDKITGRIINFDEDIGETVQFGALRVKTSACYRVPRPRPPIPTPSSRSTRSRCRAR